MLFGFTAQKLSQHWPLCGAQPAAFTQANKVHFKINKEINRSQVIDHNIITRNSFFLEDSSLFLALLSK